MYFPDMPGVDSLTIAIVDDDEGVRTALRRLLCAMGHQVRIFASAEEYELSDVIPDCLIVDLRMPGLSGFELRERLKMRGLSIPVVFISGDAGPGAGHSGHIDTPSLAKPFDDGELLTAITHAITTTREVTN
jgi:FixJ family two-component response regulator